MIYFFDAIMAKWLIRSNKLKQKLYNYKTNIIR